MATIAPDGGRPYVSKVFNDSWMREHGYLGETVGRTVGELLETRTKPAKILTVSSHDQVGRALELMRAHGISQLPVVSAEDERAFVGTVSERGLLWASADHPGILGEPVTEVLEPPLAELSVGDPADDAVRMLRDGARAVIVVDSGRPLGVLTAVDLVEALNR